MCAKDLHNEESLLHWRFLTPSQLNNNKLLEDHCYVVIINNTK